MWYHYYCNFRHNIDSFYFVYVLKVVTQYNHISTYTQRLP